VRQSFIYQNL